MLWERKEGIKGFEIKNKIKDIMWTSCSLIRDKKGLEEALSRIRAIKNDDLPRLSVPGSSRIFNMGWVEALEAVNMVDLSEMIVQSALLREESRMSHYRSDFPERDNRNWLKNIIIKNQNDTMVFVPSPPVITRMRPPVEEKIGHEG